MKHAPHSLSLLALLLWTITLSGCAEGESSKSGVSSEKTLMALTDEDSRKLCTWLANRYEARIDPEIECTWLAVAFSESPGECQSAEQACIADLVGAPALAERAGCAEETAAQELETGCSNVTVKQLESCLVDFVEDADRTYRRNSCDQLPDQPAEGSLPERCEQLDRACSAVLNQLLVSIGII